jgi:hypothetical protein
LPFNLGRVGVLDPKHRLNVIAVIVAKASFSAERGASLVSHYGIDTSSLPGRTLTAAGRKVWAATYVDVREHFPTDRDALRIVQYDSCRGLEELTVINYAFDEFSEYKYRQWIAAPELGNLFAAPEERAGLFASRWALFPLTRAMDTLVINVTSQQSRKSTEKTSPWIKL